MLLAIDVGNTNTKFAVYGDGAWKGQWRASTRTTCTADEYAPWFAGLLGFEGLGFSDITALLLWQRRCAGLAGFHGPMLEHGDELDAAALEARLAAS